MERDLHPPDGPAGRLIVALDFDSQEEALALVDRLGDAATFYKVGLQLFVGGGWPVVAALRERKKRVFLDLKLNDIDATVRAAVANMPPGPELLTIHGGGRSVAAARAGRGDADRPLILTVTVLSSLGEEDVRGGRAELALANARSALEAGCEGLIASGAAVREIRDALGGGFLIVAPGIRPGGAAADDHRNTLTPGEAITAGADYLVVGRPITRAARPEDAARAVAADIAAALGGRPR